MNKIVKQLETLPGVEILQTDVPTKRLVLRTVTHETSREQMEEAVRAIGHRVAEGETDLAEQHAERCSS